MSNTPPHTPNQTPPHTPPTTGAPSAPPKLQRRSAVRPRVNPSPARSTSAPLLLSEANRVSTDNSGSSPGPRQAPEAGTAPTPNTGARRALIFPDDTITGADIARIFNERPSGGQNCGSGSKRKFWEL